MADDAADRGAAALDAADDGADIYVRQGNLGEVVHQAAARLQAAGVPIYNYGDQLRRLVDVDEPGAGDAIERDPATRVLRPVTAVWVAYQLSFAARWWRWDVRNAGYRPADPYQRVANTIVDAGDELGFSRLRARAACPQLLADGRIQGHGYHSDTGLLVDAPGNWPQPPETPTHDDAVRALAELRELVRHYPWAGAGSESAALAAIITAVIRPTLPAAPLIAVSAPLSGAGTGKSLLARAVAMIASGRGPTTMTWPAQPGEGAKRLDAVHLAGDPVIVIDNVSVALDDDGLCTALTEPARDIRELGSSRTTRVPMVALHLATGNALTIRGDLTRRTVMVHLDPRTDRPDQREIPQDLLAECRERRGELVRAVHILLLAYQAAGEPDMGLAPMGDYRAWSRRVRAPLCWAGMPDPGDTQEALRADDPQREARTAMLTAWHAAFGGGTADGATAREAIELVTDPHQGDGDPAVEQLREAIAAVATRRGGLDAQALGRWLRSARDARVGDLVLVGRPAGQGRVRWVVYRDQVEGEDGCHGGDDPTTYAKIGRDSSDKCNRGTGGDPHHSHHPHPTSLDELLTEAVDGLTVTADDLREALSAEDCQDVAAGRIDLDALRGYARDLAQRGGE